MGSDDPLAIFTAPPADETPEQKLLREAREVEAKRVSDEIDEGLKEDRAVMRREKEVVKVLLLGQAESGMSPIPFLPLPSPSSSSSPTSSS